MTGARYGVKQVRPTNTRDAVRSTLTTRRAEKPYLGEGLRAGSRGDVEKTEQATKLTIVMPAHNEEASIADVLGGVLASAIEAETEVIVVNDGSTDRTASILAGISDPRLRVITHEQNRGKGSAVRTGLEAATGTHVLVFDADHEYDPDDIGRLVEPIRRGRAEVVYGVRLHGIHTIHPTLVHAVGNRVMTMVMNVVYGSSISDLHTCLKLLPLPLVRAMTMTETGFGLDTEITGEMLRRGFRPYEIPVGYVGRSKEEGKKIKARDALACFWVMFKVRLRGRTRPGHRDKTLAPRTL